MCLFLKVLRLSLLRQLSRVLLRLLRLKTGRMLWTVLHIWLLVGWRHRDRRWWIGITESRNVRHFLRRLVLVYYLLRHTHRCVREILIRVGLRRNRCINCRRNVRNNRRLGDVRRIELGLLQEYEVRSAYDIVDLLRGWWWWWWWLLLLLRLLSRLLLRLWNKSGSVCVVRSIYGSGWVRRHRLRYNWDRSRDRSSSRNNGQRCNLDWEIRNGNQRFRNVSIVVVAIFFVVFLCRLCIVNCFLCYSFNNLQKKFL